MTDRSRIDSASVSLGSPSPTTSRPVAPRRQVRMAWVGELSGHNAPPPGGPVPVDRDGLPALFQTLRPRLELAGQGARELAVRLEFESFRSFRPEIVARSIPELRTMLAVRATLGRLVGEPLDIEGMAEKLIQDGADPEWARRFQRALEDTRRAASAPARAPSAEDSRLSGLLSQVALPGEAPSPGIQYPEFFSFDRLVQELGGATGRRRTLEKELASRIATQIGWSLGVRLEAILWDPAFLALESAWRSLRLLVDRTDFRKGIALEVLSVTAEELVESVERDLFRPEYEAPRAPSLIAVWIDHEFGAGVHDVRRLERLASMGQSLGVPFGAAVGPAFFGTKSSSDVGQISPLWDHLKRPEYIPFASLRANEASRYLMLAFPRVLTRIGHGPGADEFRWTAIQGIERLPWGRPLAAIASRVSASVAETGWPTAITGDRGWIEDLPIVEIHGEVGSFRAPLDAVLTDSMLGELADQGFAALAAPRDSDRALLRAAPMLHRGAPAGGAGEPGDEREDSLAHRMLAAEVAGALRAVAASAPVARGADAVRAHFEDGLRGELDLGKDEESLAIVVEGAEEGRGLAVGVHLRPPAPIAGGPVELDLAIVVGS